METRKFTRQELYELVWSTPMTKLAERLGISAATLRKKCHEHDIPTPGSGYWTQLAVARAPERSALPASSSANDAIFVERTMLSPGALQPTVPGVEVQDTLAEPHPAVIWLDKALSSADRDEYQRLIVGGTWGVQACLRPVCRDRALLLIDSLFKALEARGHRVHVGVRGKSSHLEQILIVVAGSEFGVEIEEKLGRKPHVLNAEERKEKERHAWFTPPKYDYFPTKELKIHFSYQHWKYTGRKSWSDTATQRLDDLLGHFVLAVEEAARVSGSERRGAEEQARIRLEEERQRLRGERLQWWRQHLAKDLERMAADWRGATTVQSFLDAFDVARPAHLRTDVERNWFAAARAYAEKLNPLNEPSSIARDLEPSDEILEREIAAQNAGR